MTPLEMALLAGVVCAGFVAFVLALSAVEDDDVE
jgi:hypothetical protein